jgi:hypothetical protein
MAPAGFGSAYRSAILSWSEASMSKLTRTLTVAATLATISLATMTAVAHAQATDQPSSRCPCSPSIASLIWQVKD